MSRLSVSPTRNLTMYCPHKNLHMIRPIWATREGSSSSKPKKEVRFVSAKNVEKLKEVKPEIETPTVVKRTIATKPKDKGKSLPKNQRGP